MKKSLIAVATAGLIATGTVLAETTVYRLDNGTLRNYSVQDQRHWDGGARDVGPSDNNWRDDDRQLGVDQRQARLQERIQRGFDNGRLTRPEARRLQRELEDIEAKQRAFEADGRLGRREEATLQNDLDALAARARNQLRDDERRY